MSKAAFLHPPMQPEWIERQHQIAELGDLELENGEVIHDYRQSFVTHGELNSERSNLVLVCISLTGNHHRLDFLIGPGKALDTDRYFVVCADPIGNGLSTSPSNSAVQPRMQFPRFAIRDMIRAQYRLLTEVLEVNRVHAVVGASMGGMQALQWAVSHPGLAGRIVAMTPMARTHPWAALVVETARRCLTADPEWSETGFRSRPARGWAAYTALMTALLARTPAAVQEFAPDMASAQRWLATLTEQTESGGFDAHDYLYQSWAYEAHDVDGTPGVQGNALAAIKVPALIAAPPLDLFNPVESAHLAAQQIISARLVEIPSVQGHQAATATRSEDSLFLNHAIGEFLHE
ncbi:MAG: alpha/beta fold hydrolase [Betaproteobacteria bacterium]|nr:MAG: alpha/beta fold hydrolase [Betaproteobacteria bacterium]